MIYDPASDKYETQERFHPTKCWELTNLSKMTKVKGNQYYSPVLDKLIIPLDISLKDNQFPKASLVKKVAKFNSL